MRAPASTCCIPTAGRRSRKKRVSKNMRVLLALAELLLHSASAELIPGRYVNLWNAPWPHDCASPPKNLPDFSSFRISTNANASFLGDVAACVYTAGLYPMYTGMGPGGACADGDWNCTKATATNGGLPQLANLSAHLAQLEKDIVRQLPDPEWSGVANIDWESWKVSFASNRYNECAQRHPNSQSPDPARAQHCRRGDWHFTHLTARYWIYINRSMELVQSRHPEYSPEQVAQAAEREYDAAASTFHLQSLRLCQKLRPHGRWGYYDFPGQCDALDGSCDWLSVT